MSPRLHDERPDEGSHLLTAVLVALPFGLLMWAGIIGLVWRAVG